MLSHYSAIEEINIHFIFYKIPSLTPLKFGGFFLHLRADFMTGRKKYRLLCLKCLVFIIDVKVGLVFQQVLFKHKCTVNARYICST